MKVMEVMDAMDDKKAQKKYRQKHRRRIKKIDLLKKEIAELFGNTSNLKSQITAKENQLIELRKLVEDQKKEFELNRCRLARKAIACVLSVNNLAVRNKKLTEIPVDQMDIDVKSGEIDTLSVHRVAQLYGLYKQKSDQLKEITELAVYIDWSSKGDETSYFILPINYGTEPTEEVIQKLYMRKLKLLGNKLYWQALAP